MLLKEIRNYIETIGEYGVIEVNHNDLLIVSENCNNKKEFIKFMEWIQDNVIFNKFGKYNHLIGKEVDLLSENYSIATYTV